MFEAAKQGGAEGVAKAKQIIALKEEQQRREDEAKWQIKRMAFIQQEEEKAEKKHKESLEDESKRAIKALEQQDRAEKEAAAAAEKRYAQIKRLLESARTPLEVYLDKIKEYNEMLESSEITTAEWAKLTLKANEDFNNKLKNTDDILEDLRDGFKSLGASIVDAFISGKNAGEMLKSVLIDILKRMATKQLNKLFDVLAPQGKGLFNLAASGASFSDLSAAGGGSNFAAVAAGMFMADGGPVQGNEAYVVGERGPELFVPNSSGTIVPNHMLMGGGQTVNYNGPYIANMQAIDTQSAAQFLAKNKMSVWAANQSATRSIPQSR